MHDRNLIEDWIKFHHTKNKQEKEECRWAEIHLSNMSEKNPEECLEAILQIAGIDSSPTIISNLAAGPFEDLIIEHGDELIKIIEKKSKKTFIISALLREAWYEDEVSESLSEQFKCIEMGGEMNKKTKRSK